MSMAFELFIFIAIFALAIGLIGGIFGTTEDEKRKLRADHERRLFSRHSWETDEHSGGTPVR